MDEKNLPILSSIGGKTIEKNLGSRPSQIPVTFSRDVTMDVKHPDDAMAAFAGHEGAGEVLDEATSRRLLRKIDMKIMPVCQHREEDGREVRFAWGKSKK